MSQSRKYEAISCVKGVSFAFRSLPEINSVISYLSQWIPSDSYLLLGLKELMINAVEHGNLGIGYPLKTELLEQGRWLDEIERRLTLKKNQSKFAMMDVVFEEGILQATISDKGEGFDVDAVLKASQEENNTYHGRGLSLVHSLAFDKVKFSKKGTSVSCSGKI